MTCNDLSHILVEASPAAPLPSGANDHLQHCAACRRIVEALSVSLVEAPSPGILRRIEAAIATDLRPVKPIASRFSLVAALTASFLAVVAWGISGHGALALHTMTRLQACGVLGALIAGAALLAWSLIEQIIPGGSCRIPRKRLAVSTVLCLMLVVVFLFPFVEEKDFWATSWACIRTGSFIAALTAIPLWLVLRRGAILSKTATGATAGLLAGLAGTMVLETNCPNVEGWHILTAHLGAAILAAVIGLVLGVIANLRTN